MGGGPRKEENPAHLVEVSAFRLARTQVTRREYQEFLNETGGEAPPFWTDPRFGHEKMPAVGPSWNDAIAYCSWIGNAWGEAVRLPTEAEWERAARGGRDMLYPWGDTAPEDLPDYAERWLEGPEPVDAFPSRHPWGFSGARRERPRVVLGLVRLRVLRSVSPRESRGPGRGSTSVLARGCVEASDPRESLRGPLFDPSAHALQRLRVSPGSRFPPACSAAPDHQDSAHDRNPCDCYN